MTEEEEVVDKVLFRLEGSRTLTMDCYEVEFFDHKDDKETRKSYIGVIRGGYQSWMDDLEDIYDGVHYTVDTIEELMSLEIGKSFTCDRDYDILVSIDIGVDHTNTFTYTYEDIYHEDSI